MYGYSLYINKFREYDDDVTNNMTEAAIKVRDYCIESGVMKKFFTSRRNEVVGMILEEYTVENIDKEIAEMKKMITEQAELIANQSEQLASKDEEIARLKALLENKYLPNKS